MQVQTKSTVGKKLAALRKARGLSQEKLAEELLVSRQAISRWELDTVTPGADNLGILSKAFGVTVDQLLDENISAEQIVQLAGESRQRKGQDSPAETIERVFADAKEKHGMRYTRYTGLAQVANWVRLKFAAMNLKKFAIRKWEDTHNLLQILIFWPQYAQNPSRGWGFFFLRTFVLDRRPIALLY